MWSNFSQRHGTSDLDGWYLKNTRIFEELGFKRNDVSSVITTPALQERKNSAIQKHTGAVMSLDRGKALLDHSETPSGGTAIGRMDTF